MGVNPRKQGLGYQPGSPGKISNFFYPEIAGDIVDFRISLSAVSLICCRLDAQE